MGRGRGRPKGSKNKSKEIKITSLEIRRLRGEIRDIKTKKLLLPSGSKERIELGRELKKLKQELKGKKEFKINKIIEINTPEPDKDKLITEILRIEKDRKTIPTFETLGINLHKYTIKQLEIHLKKIKKGLPE